MKQTTAQDGQQHQLLLELLHVSHARRESGSWPHGKSLYNSKTHIGVQDGQNYFHGLRATVDTIGALNSQHQGKKSVFYVGPFVQESRTMAHLALTRTFYSQLQQPPCTVIPGDTHLLGETHPPPLVPPFLLV